MRGMSDLLPDLAPGVITWSDAINVVIAAVGVYIAYLGGKLAKQQTELAAKADRISSVQLGRAAQAEVHSVMTYDLGGTLRDVGIQLRNVGVADIEGFSWHLSHSGRPGESNLLGFFREGAEARGPFE